VHPFEVIKPTLSIVADSEDQSISITGRLEKAGSIIPVQCPIFFAHRARMQRE